MAAIAIAHSSVRSILSPGARGGGRLWHAPLPSRNRFAVHGAESSVPTILDARGGGRWSPSARGSAQFSSTPDEQAMWRALLDIRAFAVRMDERSLRQEQANAVFASQQLETLRQVKKIVIKQKSGKGFGILFFSSLFLVTWGVFYLGAENGVDMLDEFLKTRLNKIVTDPETQRNIQHSATLYTDTICRRFNPWHRFSSWITGEEAEEAIEFTTTEVSRDSFLALSIILLLQVNHKFGSTSDELMENLKIIGMKDEQKNFAVLQLLENMGYVETMDTFKKQRGYAKSYWPSKKALVDCTSGRLEKNVSKALSSLMKENQVASADRAK